MCNLHPLPTRTKNKITFFLFQASMIIITEKQTEKSFTETQPLGTILKDLLELKN